MMLPHQSNPAQTSSETGSMSSFASETAKPALFEVDKPGKFSHAKKTNAKVQRDSEKYPKESAERVLPQFESLLKKFSHAKVLHVMDKIRRLPEIHAIVTRELLKSKEFKSYSIDEIDAIVEPLIKSVQIGDSSLYAFADESTIADKAAEYASDMRLYVKTNPPSSNTTIIDVQQFAFSVSKHFDFTGVPFPTDPMRKLVEHEQEYRSRIISALARFHCERWWRRQLRNLCYRCAEDFYRNHGYVGRGRSAYISTYTSRRKHYREQASRAYLESSQLESDIGEILKLADVADSSTSNPRNRLAEAYARAVGCDEILEALGLDAIFVTITAPSRFHPMTVRKDYSVPNPKFDGSTPRDCQKYLVNVWARARAANARAGIDTYGMRVAEPHHDGTPHWHMVLYVEPSQRRQLVDILRRYACMEDPEELNTEKRKKARFDYVLIDCAQGLPRTYLFKYLTKNITGSSELSDETGKPISDGIDAVRRLSSTYSIRQFQFFGQPSVTVWRQLRRLRDKNLGEVSAEEFSQIRDAAVAGDWAKFVNLMGGVCTPRSEQPIRPDRVVRGENDYGEITYEIRGLVMALALSGNSQDFYSVSVSTQDKRWTLVPPGEVARRGRDLGLRSREARPLG